ncbi:MAG: DUF2218 domain-containing protein [Rhizobiaceae bacterium]
MPHATVSVSTRNASRYMQQLSKHWGHKAEAVFDTASSRIDFGDETVVTMQAGAEALHIDVACAPERLERFTQVVEDHIQRFAFREELDFAWSQPQ